MRRFGGIRIRTASRRIRAFSGLARELYPITLPQTRLYLPNLAAYRLDSTGVVATENQRVATWLDASSYSRHATQTVNGDRPRLTANGMEAVGGNEYMNLASTITLDGSWTMWALAKHNGLQGLIFLGSSSVTYQTFNTSPITIGVVWQGNESIQDAALDQDADILIRVTYGNDGQWYSAFTGSGGESAFSGGVGTGNLDLSFDTVMAYSLIGPGLDQFMASGVGLRSILVCDESTTLLTAAQKAAIELAMVGYSL